MSVSLDANWVEDWFATALTVALLTVVGSSVVCWVDEPVGLDEKVFVDAKWVEDWFATALTVTLLTVVGCSVVCWVDEPVELDEKVFVDAKWVEDWFATALTATLLTVVGCSVGCWVDEPGGRDEYIVCGWFATASDVLASVKIFDIIVCIDAGVKRVVVADKSDVCEAMIGSCAELALLS